MDLNCTEDVISTGTKDTSSIIAPQAITSPAPPETLVNTLCRMSSGASVIIDSDHNGVETESSRRKLVSSRFKGVVPQPNGRWGAQIYERHQRVWLGTFNQQDDAARVYDVAAQRFRGRDAVTNFKPLGTDSVEYSFLVRHSKAEIVDMLRKHTYTEELEQSKRHSVSNINKRDPVGSGSGPPQEQLFRKTVTPSDVGKLNRLVIPKQHAEKHFPLQRVSPASSKGLLLNFEDAGGKVWRFRYSYWNSSQSYVLTKGWSRFVKEKNLHAGDVVSFCKSSGQLYIDFMSRAELLALNATQLRSDNNAVRLFGVDIGKSSGNSKLYNKEMELFGFGSCKRRRGLL